jgi:PEP-CTERM motif
MARKLHGDSTVPFYLDSILETEHEPPDKELKAMTFLFRPGRALVAALLLLGALLQNSQASVVRQFANGLLTGATGVSVNGVIYDVSFQDGSCDSLFANCTNFAFTTSVDAIAASDALLGQVIHYAPNDLYDNDPTKTNGCSVLDFCLIATPFLASNGFEAGYAVMNYPLGSQFPDGTAPESGPVAYDLSLTGAAVYAVWVAEPTVITVPEPSSLALLGASGLALVWARRRRGLISGSTQLFPQVG